MVHHVRDDVVIAVDGDLDDPAVAARVYLQALGRFGDSPVPATVVLNLSNTPRLSMASAAGLVHLRDKLARDGWRLALQDPSPGVMTTLVNRRLLEVFEVTPSLLQ